MQSPDNPDRIAIAGFMAGGSAEITSSPLLKELGCTAIEAAEGEVSLQFCPAEKHVQGAGAVAGGITATILDFSLAFAGLSTCQKGESGASIGLNVQFLKPVKAEPVVAKAWLTSNGFKIAQAQAELRDQNGTLLATAQSALAMKRHAR